MAPEDGELVRRLLTGEFLSEQWNKDSKTLMVQNQDALDRVRLALSTIPPLITLVDGEMAVRNLSSFILTGDEASLARLPEKAQELARTMIAVPRSMPKVRGKRAEEHEGGPEEIT